MVIVVRDCLTVAMSAPRSSGPLYKQTYLHDWHMLILKVASDTPYVTPMSHPMLVMPRLHNGM